MSEENQPVPARLVGIGPTTIKQRHISRIPISVPLSGLEHPHQDQTERVVETTKTSNSPSEAPVSSIQAPEDSAYSYRNSFEAVALTQVPRQTLNRKTDNNFKPFLKPVLNTQSTRFQIQARYNLSDQMLEKMPPEPIMFQKSILPARYATPSFTTAHSPGPRPQSYIPTNPDSVFVIPLELELLTYPALVQGPAQLEDKPSIIPFLAGNIELKSSTKYRDLLHEITDIYNELQFVGKLPGLPIQVGQVTMLSLKTDVTEDNIQHMLGMTRRREGSETLVATIKPVDSWKDDIGSERVDITVVSRADVASREVQYLRKERRNSI